MFHSTQSYSQFIHCSIYNGTFTEIFGFNLIQINSVNFDKKRLLFIQAVVGLADESI